MSESTLKILSTTSTRDSGFYNYILPIFEKKYGIKTYTINTGTGQAIMNAKNCNGDVLITHSKNLENEFVKNGYGLSRADLMHNSYVLVGPSYYKSLFENIKTSTPALIAYITDSFNPKFLVIAPICISSENTTPS